MKLYEGIASAIIDETGGPVFGLMGDGNMSLWGALVRDGRCQIYSARNEAGAVAMADGYFRATGKVGLATITCGPGLTQVGTSLMAAARNRTPLVLVMGEMPPSSKNKLQWFDQRRFAEACESLYHTVTDPENAADQITEAFFAAHTRQCPVVLNLPIDIQERELEWEWDYRSSQDFLPSQEEPASDAALEQLADRLIAAQRPVLIAGRGARRSGARDSIVAIAERIGAVLGTSLQAKGMFDGHAYDVGIAGTFSSAPAETLFAEADFVLAVGAELGYYTAEGGLLFPTAEVARLDIAPTPRDLGVLPGLYLRGEARTSMAKLAKILELRQARNEGFHTTATRETLAYVAEDFPAAGDGLDQRQLMHALSPAIPADAVITCGAGHFFGFIAMHLAIPASVDIQFCIQFGAVGQALPNAIGIGVANPGKPHLLIEGDGSLMMNLQELDTVVRHKLPLVMLIINDAGYGAEVHKLKLKGFDPSSAVHGSPDFVTLARGFGGDGEVLQSEDDIGAALARGFAAGGLYVIDARVSPSTISDAYQKVHMGIPVRSAIPRHAAGEPR